MGTVTLGTDSFSIMLRPIGRNSPDYSVHAETLFFIDLSHDGKFSVNSSLASDGTVIPSEDLSLSEPFRVSGQNWEVVSIENSGPDL